MKSSITVNDGKYTVEYEQGKLRALRYGEPWRDLAGDNLVYWLAAELEEAREKLADAKSAECQHVYAFSGESSDHKSADFQCLRCGKETTVGPAEDHAKLCGANLPLLKEIVEALDVAQALTEKSLHHPKILKAYRGANAVLVAEQHPDDLAVDRFAVVMKAKLAKKRMQGRYGWEDKNECSAEHLSSLLRGHVDKGDPVDVANLAMMLQQRGERIAGADEKGLDDE